MTEGGGYIVMNRNRRNRIKLGRLSRVGMIWVVLIWSALCFVGQADAELTTQSANGTVEVLVAGDQSWRPLVASMKLKTGDQIRTGPNSSVDLWFEDGSMLNLAESTQLSINELEISTAQKSRVARFKLWWGTVTAKVTKLAFTENICEVETDTVVAGVKFSEMTIVHPQNVPQSEVIARQGLISVRRIAADERIVNISGLLSQQEGVQFALPPEIGTEVFVGVQKILGKIEIESSQPISGIQALFEPSTSFLKVDNAAQYVVDLVVEGTLATLEPEASATFGLPAGLELTMNTIQETDVAVAIKRRTAAISCEGVYVFLNGGALSVNDESVKVGVPNCFPIGMQPPTKSRSLIQREEEAPTRAIGEEQPVAPDAPDAQNPQGRDIPTPTPTVAPTPTETPIEWEYPTPTPTPTPDEDESWDPEPEPEPEPEPTRVPPHPPTPTPASPTLPESE